MPVPDVTGQPAWVIVVLAVLAVVSTLGVAWFANRSRKSATAEEQPQATLPGGGQDTTAVVIQSALDHLARVAEREAAESTEARREMADLRRSLETARADYAAILRRAEEAEASLALCRQHASLLADKAFRRDEP